MNSDLFKILDSFSNIRYKMYKFFISVKNTCVYEELASKI